MSGWLWRQRVFRSRAVSVCWGEDLLASGPFFRCWSAHVLFIPREDLTDDMELILSALVLSLKVRMPRNLCGAAHIMPRPLVRWDGWNRVIRADTPEPRYLVRLEWRSNAGAIADRNARACGQWGDSGPPNFLGETASPWTLWRSTHEAGGSEVGDVVDRAFPRRLRAPAEEWASLPRSRYRYGWDLGGKDRTAHWIRSA